MRAIWILILGLFIKALTQAIGPWLPDMVVYKEYDLKYLVACIGTSFFDLCTVWYAIRMETKYNKREEIKVELFLLNFFMALIIYDIFKFLFLYPYSVEPLEYLNFIGGIIYSIVIYIVYKYNQKRGK